MIRKIFIVCMLAVAPIFADGPSTTSSSQQEKQKNSELTAMACGLPDLEMTRSSLKNTKIIGVSEGLFVIEPVPGGPADIAGIKEFDVVISIAGIPTKTVAALKDVADAVGKIGIGGKCQVVYMPREVVDGNLRYTNKKTVMVTIEAKSKFAMFKEFGFRDCKWGMTKEEVKKTEQIGNPIKSSDDEMLCYNGKIAGLSCEIVYIFMDGKLVRGKYLITEKHAESNSFVGDHINLRKLLTEKYGKSKDDTIWKNDLYRSKPDEIGMAVSVGHLSVYSTWKAADETILLVFKGDNYKIDLQIEYSSNKYSSVETKKISDEEKKGL